jgi:hypothetical protein
MQGSSNLLDARLRGHERRNWLTLQQNPKPQRSIGDAAPLPLTM